MQVFKNICISNEKIIIENMNALKHKFWTNQPMIVVALTCVCGEAYQQADISLIRISICGDMKQTL